MPKNSKGGEGGYKGGGRACQHCDIYSGIDALPVNYRLHSGVGRFVPIEDTAISDHRS